MSLTAKFAHDIIKAIDKKDRDRLLKVITSDHEKFIDFVKSLVKNSDNSSVLLDTLLSFLSELAFSDIIDLSVQLLKESKRDSSESVIAYASLQFPHLLHKYAQDLFELKPNENTYYENWFLREIENFEFITSISNKQNSLWAMLTQKPNIDINFNLFQCLLQIRTVNSIKSAIDLAKKVSLFDKLGDICTTKTFEENINMFINNVGFDLKGEQILQLQSKDKTWHFVFENDYLSSVRTNFMHPTWYDFESEYEFEFKMGGVLQNKNEDKLFHVITLDPIPDFLEVSIKKLILGFEFEYYEKAFYKHDEDGFPHHFQTEEVSEKFEVDEIAPTKIRLLKTPKRWYYQDWALSNDRENLNRFGGEPTWIQRADYPICPQTGETMQFLFQIDNIPSIGEYGFGGEGIYYFFYCDISKISTYVYQQT